VLCRDGRDETFRQTVALAMHNYKPGQHLSLEELAKGSRKERTR
jgi:hypothetical protein